jgi:hypothetical protein
VAEVLNSMGLVLISKKNYIEAEDSLQRALKIVQDQLGMNHYKVSPKETDLQYDFSV